jgi:hypothetical protein
MSKRKRTPRRDPGYDMNVSAAVGAEESPWGGIASDIALFSPQRPFVPEPGSVASSSLGLAALAAWRRRRWAMNR